MLTYIHIHSQRRSRHSEREARVISISLCQLQLPQIAARLVACSAFINFLMQRRPSKSSPHTHKHTNTLTHHFTPPLESFASFYKFMLSSCFSCHRLCLCLCCCCCSFGSSCSCLPSAVLWHFRWLFGSSLACKCRSNCCRCSDSISFFSALLAVQKFCKLITFYWAAPASRLRLQLLLGMLQWPHAGWVEVHWRSEQ